MTKHLLSAILRAVSLTLVFGNLAASQATQKEAIVDSVVNDPKFTIEYKQNYKVLTNKIVNEVYILYTDPIPPSVEVKYEAMVHIPVTTVGATDPQVVGFLELLGKIPALKYLKDASTLPMICSNAVSENISEGNTTFVNDVDVAFFPLETPRSSFNATKAITVSITDDLRPLAKLLWLRFFAAFFNMEDTAEIVINSIATRYLGHSTAVRQQKDQLFAIAWVQREDNSTWNTAVDKYRTTLTEDAGGEMVPLNPMYTSKEHLRSDIHNAYMVIDESRSPIIEEALYWINDMGYASVEDAEFLTKKRLWRIGKTTSANGVDDWKVRSAARPDLVLEDVITARYRRSGIQYIALETYKRHFLAELTSSEDSVVLQQQVCSGPLLSEPAVWNDWPKAQTVNLNNPGKADPFEGKVVIAATVIGIILGVGVVGYLVVFGTKRIMGRRFVRMNEEPEMQMSSLN